MAATVPSLPWVPEDDVLLKRSVEAGASLESLAKGAVQFSRRYTLKEIRDRWYSLLYDPETVMEASPHMFEIERLEHMKPSKPIKSESAKEIQFSSRKRKSDSVRKRYYAMRKRICNEPCDISAIGFIPMPNSPNNNLGAEDQEFDPFPEFGPLTAYENTQFGPGPDHGNEIRPGPFRNHAGSSSTMPQAQMLISSDISVPVQIGEQGQNAEDAFTVPRPSNNANKVNQNNCLAKISDTLFDDQLFIDNDGKEAIDDSYYDGLSSLLLDANGGDLPQVETSMPEKIFGPEYTNGVICCTLNSSETEIPDNEDVFLPFSDSSSDFPYVTNWRSEDSSCLYSPPLVNKIPRGRKPKNNQKQPSDESLKYLAKDKGVKFELPKSNINHMAPRNARSINSANVTANCYIDDGVDRRFGSVETMDSKKNFNGTIGVCVDNNNVSEGISCEEAIDKAQLSESEEWSENVVPYFSDVEAMILGMDLTPVAHLNTSSLAMKYLDEESKRTIIRLEQTAYACAQRDVSSHSAFAVLRNRWNKYFIRKPEVILGRSTEEINVDIDLGREKKGSKISRRQARIKLDTNGVFQLTNLGKNTILMNEIDVLPGESCSLDSKSLIVVRGMAFIFFVNRKLVDEFVSSNGECGRPSNGS